MVASTVSRAGSTPFSLSCSRWSRSWVGLSLSEVSSASFSSAFVGAIFSGSSCWRSQSSMPSRLMSASTFGVAPNVMRVARCRIASLASTVFTVTLVASAAAAGLP